MIKTRTGPLATALVLRHSPVAATSGSPSSGATTTAQASALPSSTASAPATATPTPSSTPTASPSIRPTQLPAARAWASMAYDPAHDVTLLFGGFSPGSNPYLGDTWAWDGSRWAVRHPPASPSARFGAAMAGDAARSRVVLFGGAGPGIALGDTWTWDGTSWSLQTPPVSPPARSDAVMGYDGGRNLVVLFGGRGLKGTALRDTWTWDGATWAQIKTSSSPPGRQGGVLGYDTGSQQMILAGSVTADSAAMVPWAFNGSTWTQLQATTADRPPQHYGAFYGAFGPSAAITIFGGVLSPTDPVQTWSWTGTRWSLATPTTMPSPRGGGMQPATPMAYDSHRHQLVLFSGQGPNGWLNDTWTWDGSTWARHG